MRKMEKEELSLSAAAQLLLDECRMVLPGIQALLGFQLIAVFSPGFDEKLGLAEQRVHLAAIAMVAAAVAIIMAPAAYHRQTGLREVTETFVRLCTRLLLISMLPLALGICLDFYLIAGILFSGWISALLTAGLLGVFVALWFLLPRATALQRILGGQK